MSTTKIKVTNKLQFLLVFKVYQYVLWSVNPPLQFWIHGGPLTGGKTNGQLCLIYFIYILYIYIFGIGATFGIGQESWCLPYAEFFCTNETTCPEDLLRSLERQQGLPAQDPLLPETENWYLVGGKDLNSWQIPPPPPFFVSPNHSSPPPLPPL